MTSVDSVFKAISHPTRRDILSLLLTSPRSVKELTHNFEMSQPAISQHLKELKNADLVASNRVGLEQHYRLTPRPLKHVLQWTQRYRTLIDPSGQVWSLTSLSAGQKDHKTKRRKRNGS